MAELNGEPAGLEALQTLALTNYGHFTTLRVERGRVRGLSLHLERLVRDCRTVFDTALNPERVRELVRRAAPRDGSGIVRVTVFDPALDLGRIGADAYPHVLVTTRPAGGPTLPPLRVRSAVHVRELPAVKSVGLFDALRHRREVQRTGYDDALFVDGQAVVSEGSTWNIGFVRGERVIWPDAECLPGITMRLLQQAHPCVSVPVRLTDLPGFDAAFATNAATGIRVVSAVDDVSFPDTHPMIEELRRTYTALPGDPL